MAKSKKTKENLDLMVSLREAGYSIKEACAKIGVSNATLVRWGFCDVAKGYKPRTSKKYPRDVYIFQDIETSDKAYWLGLLLADGCITEDGDLILSLTDEELVKGFADFVGGDVPYRRVKRNPGKDQFFYRAKSLQYKKDLEKWGITPRKTYKPQSLPNISLNLMGDFIRGLFDGDGTVYTSKGYLVVGFTGRVDLLNHVRTLLISQCHMASSVNTHTFKDRPQFGSLHYRSKDDVTKLYNFMYNKSSLYLNRKKRRFDNSGLI